MSKLTHLDQRGSAMMVDISEKHITSREAYAQAIVEMKESTLDLVFSGTMPKGDVFSIAKIAGIQAAKKTSELIPLCHPLPLSKVDINFERDGATKVVIFVHTKVNAQTGVEMEAMTAASVAALTVYDMCKGVERGIRIHSVRLLRKTGGKDGEWGN